MNYRLGEFMGYHITPSELVVEIVQYFQTFHHLIWVISLMIRLNSSKIVGDSAIKTTALAKLRRPDSDAAAVAQFVDSVENVDDIETDFDGSLFRDLDLALQIDVECFVGMIFLRVGKTSS